MPSDPFSWPLIEPTRRQVLLGLMAGAVGCGSKPVERWSPAIHKLKDRIGGKNRTCAFIVPDGLAPDALAPMVIGMHDTGDDPETAYEKFGWREVCAERGWLGLFPSYGKGNQKADNVYLTHLILRGAALGGGDPTRVYIVGHGAGGRRAYAMACQYPEWITAIAAASAAVRFREEDLGFQDPKPPAVSVMHLHGGADARVPTGGGPLDCGDHKTRQVVPLDEALKPWIEQIDGKKASMALKVPTVVDAARWTGGGRDVVRLIDPAGDHNWNADYWTRLVADFFAAAPRRPRAQLH